MSWDKPRSRFADAPLVNSKVKGSGYYRMEKAEQKGETTPLDHIQMAPKRPKKGGHENPKPDEFGKWVISVTLGPRMGDVCELYAGTAPVARAADEWGMDAVGVDLKDWTRGAA